MKILILEDEAPATERLTNLLELHAPNSEIIGILDTGEEAIQKLEGGLNPDLILSDIELADGLCFDIFSQTKTTVPVIFTTAYNQYAIRAFEANAIDYLLKPLKVEELKTALKKAELRMSYERERVDYDKIAEAIERKSETKTKRYLVRYGQKMFVVDPNEAAYFYSEQKSTFLVDRSGKTYPLDESLTQAENDVSEGEFFRINRKFLVNINSIGEMKTYGKARIKVEVNPPHDTEENLVVSTERTPDFRKWLKG